MDADYKELIIHDLNRKIGGDINDLSNAYELETDLLNTRNELQSSLNDVNNEVPTKICIAIKRAEVNTKQINTLKERSVKLKKKVEIFLNKTEPIRYELNNRITTINKLENVLAYTRSFKKVEELSNQMKQCNDDEQLVLWYGELREMCQMYKIGHRSSYVREYTHYWHNVLKDKITKQYEDVLKLVKWPFTTSTEYSPPPKEIMVKFSTLTKYLFLIKEPTKITVETESEDFEQEQDPCIPVRILLRPLKKRFAFHFTGSRQTARIDRPEWFFTQTLSWIKDHQGFIKSNVQPVADKLELKKIKIVDEFNAGLIALAAERLHTVLGLYQTQGSKGNLVDIDAAFAHAVDETLGFHKELVLLTGKDTNSVLSVLTKAEIFVRWLAVEKKYALAKMDEILGSEQWSEPVAAGVGAAVGSLVWVPRGADWLISLLKTIEDRYVVLPQPGHRLQFLELQLELVEEWRVRLTQLLSAAVATLTPETFLVADSTPHQLTAVINAAHHTRTILLQWAHSLHYLQLHYYRRQFLHFTQQHHHDEESESSSSDEDDSEEDSSRQEGETEETLSLKELEVRAKKLALSDMSQQDSIYFIDMSQFDITSPIANLAVTEPLSGDTEVEEAGVFAEAPGLLAHLRDAGLAALVEHIMLEFKAGLRDYKKQKWHAMLTVEQMALTVSTSLCRPLSALYARLSAATAKLAPAQSVRLRAQLAQDVDQYIFEEVVLENWFNTGGTVQFTHDFQRNIAPAFSSPNTVPSLINQLPKLLESCKLLNMDYEDARRIRGVLAKKLVIAEECLITLGIKNIQTNEALQILNQRTDLSDAASPSSVMELF